MSGLPSLASDRQASVDWAGLFFGMSDRLMARARKRYGPSEDAEAAYNYSLDCISTDDWVRLGSSYKGLGSPEAFLAVTFCNYLEEYAVRKYGRRRPPAWLRRLESWWLTCYRMLCLQRLLPETVVERLSADGDPAPGRVRQAIREIRKRIPNCGAHFGEQVRDDGGEANDLPDDEAPGDVIESGELAVLTEILRGEGYRSPPGEGGPELTKSLEGRLSELQRALGMTPDERLIARLIYQERCSVSAAARRLGLPDHQVRRRHQAMLRRWRAALEEFGF